MNITLKKRSKYGVDQTKKGIEKRTYDGNERRIYTWVEQNLM